MNDYQLGAALRTQVIQDRQRGLPVDGRRLQALVGDLAGAEQAGLLPALRYLVFSPAFHSAASQAEPLADPRLLTRMMQELQEVFTAAICQRMQAVVQGLLALPGAPAPPRAPAAAAAPPTLPAPVAAPEPLSRLAVPVPAAAPHAPTPEQALALLEAQRGEAGGGGSRSLVVVLSFLCGGLLVGLAGLLVFLQMATRRQPQLATTPLRQAAPVAQPVQPPTTPALPAPEPSAPPETASTDAASLDQAIARVEELYGVLSSKDYDTARGFFSGAAADQFDPTFFNQFERVSVSGLRESGRSGSSVTLEGQVTFLYPDGTSQLETRNFTVDTGSTPAQITASAFGQVLKPRQ